MAYPNLYSVTYSYTGFQQSQQGVSAFPGTQLDADLAGLTSSIDDVAAFVQKTIRADGNLNNGIVTADSLSTSLVLGYAPPTQWLPFTNYTAGVSTVFQGGVFYSAKVSHTSAIFFDASKWNVVFDFGSVVTSALGPYQPLVTAVPTLQSEVGVLMSALSNGHAGFTTKALMDAAVGSYVVGNVAECYDPNPSLAGIYIRQVTATWGVRAALLPAAAVASFDMALLQEIPTVGGATAPVVVFRVDQTNWIIRTLLVNGKPGEYIEWLVKDIAPVTAGSIRLFILASISTNENGIRRIQSDFNIHGADFEYAMNVGLMTDSLSSGFWGFYGNGHGHVVSNGMLIQLDGVTIEAQNPDGIVAMAPGTFLFGSSLKISQGFNILLPKDGATQIGTIHSEHVFDSTGCNLLHIHFITAAGIGNMNSYSAMLPVTGCDTARFGGNAPLAINLFDSSQSANQGHQSLVQAWHSDRPDLIVEMILPTGNPGSPDIYTDITTSDTFVINNPAYSKCYINSRSGIAAVAADATSTHQTQYRVRKTGVGTPFYPPIGTSISAGTLNGLAYYVAPNSVSSMPVGLNGQLLLGVTGAASNWATMSGDATINNAGVVTVTLAIGRVTGLAANIATGLGLGFSVGNGFVQYNGPGGTPSSLTLTNATGLPVAGGGTGVATIPAHGLMVGAGTSNVATVVGVAGNSGQPLLSQGSVADPIYGLLNLANCTGTLQAAQEPAHTGDVTNAAGSLALLIGATKVTSAMLNADVFSTAHSWGGQQTFTAPVLGTPASGVATNLTGTAAGLTAGNVTTNANMTGDVTSVGNVTTLTSATVTGKLLTGYVSGAGVVAATDSILAAFQKINGNDALKLPLAGGTMSGAIAMGGNNITAVPGIIGGTAAGSTLTLQSTSSGAASGDSVVLATGNNGAKSTLRTTQTGVGINTAGNPIVDLQVGGVGGANAGYEVVVSTNITMQAFNRNTAAYATYNIAGSSINLQAGTPATVLAVSATTAALTGVWQTKQGSVAVANGLNSNIAAPTASWVRLTGPTGAFSIGGFTGGVDGQELVVYNTTAQTMTIVNEDASSTAGNRLKTLTGGNVVLRATATSSATFRYDATDSRWILISSN